MSMLCVPEVLFVFLCLLVHWYMYEFTVLYIQYNYGTMVFSVCLFLCTVSGNYLLFIS